MNERPEAIAFGIDYNAKHEFNEDDERYAEIYQTLVDQNIPSEKFWIDRVWEQKGVVQIDEKVYDRQIATHRAGERPWWVVFGRTPYLHYKEENYQLTTLSEEEIENYSKMEMWIKKMMALKEMYGEEIQVGFIDSTADELIKESF